MTREKNIETVRRAIHLFEEPNIDEFTELFSDDGRWVQPFHSGLFDEEVVGRKEIRNSLKSMAVNFETIQFPIQEILPFEDPNKIAVKHTGRLVMKNDRGIYANDYFAIISFDEGGKISEWIEYYNPIITARVFGLLDKVK